ncbi:ATP-binding protein [Heliorestis convoluta]|uniref:Transcriptional regulator n=1 Tax=Heliorestis convoluta TaxID=356322 RepID=A0A5Q2N1I8_9FIRM|nr:ATP-binding protein [Heliorestis convoluta]QGG48868.1 transcriptional regulator [Heliorestis convoluta]
MSDMNYTDEELEALLDDLESDLAERKESWNGDSPEKGRQAVCAFANDLPNHAKPGVLFVGAKDNGVPSSLTITDNLLQTLADIKTDGNILPPPTIIVQKRKLKGDDMAVVIVQPADAPPVRYKGRIWIRTGPRRGIASAQDERILNEKRRFRDLPFDIQPLPSTDLSSLNRLQFEQEYLPFAFAPEILNANGRSYEQRLAACRMVVSADNPTPTILGILVIGNRPRDFIPGAYIQFLRIDGTEFSDPIIDEEEIDGTIGQMLKRLEEKLEAHNRVRVDITSNSLESRKIDYPLAALHQLTRNAVMHRTYEGTNAPVRLFWFNDRIEIISPGGPFGEVTIENFGKPGITDYRNRHLADAMRVYGLVQRFGVGISIAQKELQRNGNGPIEFEVSPTTVLCIVRKRK